MITFSSAALPSLTPVQVRNVLVGSGKPSVVVPLVGGSPSEVMAHAQALKASRFDIVEWRIDLLQGIDSVPTSAAVQEVVQLGQQIRTVLGSAPLLVTYRTAHEGGQGDMDDSAYGALLIALASTGVADAFDVEAFRTPLVVEQVISAAHAARIPVVASSHDFDSTPSQEEIVRRLRHMQDDLGADILKIAVMPRTPGDVLTLLSATWDMRRLYAEQPLITMSMSKLGTITRLAGHVFGSAAVFGATEGKSSAPGQIDVQHLHQVLQLMGHV